MRLDRSIRNQTGDTIVEVLIAIAIISSVVSTAYATMNSSVKSNQESQEHASALKVAESQLELFKGWLAASNTLPVGVNSFCMKTVPTVSVEPITATVPSTDNSVYPANCKNADDDAPERFMTAIVRDPSTNRYTVYIDWDGPKGDRSSVNLLYKVYP